MLFYVHRLREKGLLIPRHHLVRTEGPVGELSLKEEKDRETLRTLRVARLLAWPRRDGDVIPPLMDAMLIHVGESWTMTGWERGESLNGLFAPAFQQSWWMTPLKLSDLRELESERIAALDPP